MHDPVFLYIAHSSALEVAHPPAPEHRLVKVGKAGCLGYRSASHNAGFLKDGVPVTPALALQDDWTLLAWTRPLTLARAKRLEKAILATIVGVYGEWPHLETVRRAVREEAARKGLARSTSGLTEIVTLDPHFCRRDAKRTGVWSSAVVRGLVGEGIARLPLVFQSAGKPESGSSDFIALPCTHQCLPVMVPKCPRATRLAARVSGLGSNGLDAIAGSGVG